MAEMTLEERILRLEAHLGIGDSPEAERTRARDREMDAESRRWSARMRYLVDHPFVPGAAERLNAELDSVNH